MEATVPRSPARRWWRLRVAAVSLGVVFFLGLIVILPILPWIMGIVTDVKYTYISAVPLDNNGAYMLTDRGVMELYPWLVEPDDFPPDAAVLQANRVHAIAVVEKQFDVLSNYQLYNLTTGSLIPWKAVSTKGTERVLTPAGPLTVGRYMFIYPSDSMYGGDIWQYFELK